MSKYKDGSFCFERKLNMICNYSNAIAMNYGINAALIAGYINYRLETKSAVAVGDKFWVRITQKSLTATFPFMGEKAVRNAIRKLKKANILSVKQLGKDRFDHGYFYTLTAYGKTVIKGDEEFE